MAHLLGAEQLHLSFPNREVFGRVTLGLNAGDRVGVVGRNGDGKSSLLALLAGRLEPDSGQVTMRGGLRIGVLDQADTLDARATVAHSVVGDTAEHEWAGDARIRDVIAGLLTDIDWQAEVGTLSGGQRRRVALAQLLVGDHDVLLLDEPTNHLDVEGIAWLARHLKTRWPSSQGAFVTVTHDRWFLDEVCTSMWEVHDGVVDAFEGGYAAYVLQRVERDRQAASVEAKRQNLMRKELAWLRRGAPARTSKPKFRIDAANALIEDEPPVRNPVELQQLAVARLGKDVVDLEDVSVGYGEKLVLQGVTWRIAPGERTGILGVNGAGKSTLLALVRGSIQPASGRRKQGKTVQIATLSQELDELLERGSERVSAIVAEQRTSYQVGGKELSPGQLLERLGFDSRQLSTPVKDLSGGQKRRLQLLLILLGEPNVLILDEPTNDLDTDMLAAMEDLLDSWPGTLLVVSHDRYLLERVTDQQYAVLDGHLRHLPGGIDEYLKLSAARSASRPEVGNSAAVLHASDRPPRGFAALPPNGPSPETGLGAGVAASARNGRRSELQRAMPASALQSSNPTGSGHSEARESGSAHRPQLSGAERRAVEKEMAAIDRRLVKLQGEIAAQHEALAAHDQSDYVGLGALTARLQQLEGEVADLKTRWLELSEL